MSTLFRFPTAVNRDPEIDRWLEAGPNELGAIASHWFGVLRACGPDVRELLHDGHPTACVDDAAFAYVDVFRAHVNVGFFRGAELDDPQRLLVGTGKRMRHVKVRPDADRGRDALVALIRAAYLDMRQRVQLEQRTP